MFTPDRRARLRDFLIAAAQADHRISGAARTGSAAAGREDQAAPLREMTRRPHREARS
ncbi:hypothetical protein [Amycolatopsis granulosa]|uniref:hypothetical protein n=1 Tax=Amycolatopsis granulosa TaxID=185684 RepID=UPI001FBBE60D|nr:hypothetical protein [Amycolatopsis granulosa]NIH86594.1 hypothetical protein [Amycolatopsis granulosa]